MSNSLLTELTMLLQETALLLACPDSDTDHLESYGRWRQEIFSRLQHTEDVEAEGEAKSLRAVLTQIQEQDCILLQQLDMQRIRCQAELSAVMKARQAMKDSTSSFTGRLLERHL